MITGKDILAAYKLIQTGQLDMLDDTTDKFLQTVRFQKVNRDFDKLAVVYWWMNVYDPNSGYWDTNLTREECQKIWESWNNASYIFKFARPSGYVIATNQACIKLSAYTRVSVQRHLDELKMWLPYIKPYISKGSVGETRTDEPQKHISLFEHTLSAGGSYSIRIFSENDIELTMMRYHRFSVEKKFSNLEEMMEYVITHHWYEKGKR